MIIILVDGLLVRCQIGIPSRKIQGHLCILALFIVVNGPSFPPPATFSTTLHQINPAVRAQGVVEKEDEKEDMDAHRRRRVRENAWRNKALRHDRRYRGKRGLAVYLAVYSFRSRRSWIIGAVRL